MFNAGFELNPEKDVPQDVQQRAAGVSLELEQDELRQAESLDGILQDLGAKYQKELHSIVGGEDLERYHEFRLGLRLRLPYAAKGERSHGERAHS